MANNMERILEADRKEPVTVDGRYIKAAQILGYYPPGRVDDPEHSDTCGQCAKHFRTLSEQAIASRAYADMLDYGGVHKLAANFTGSIFEDLEYLRQKIRSHGDAIVNRWKKKSETQRRAFVLAIVPDMFEKKAPQPRLAYSGDGWIWKRQHRNVFLLPYLTVDNICDDKSKLISLLHNRTCYGPQDWVMFDSEQLQDGYCRGSLELRFSPGCVVMHGKAYGTLVNWDREAAHAWTIVGWPRAHLILEAQAKLLHFLRGMVDMILEGCQAQSGSEKWRETVAAGITTQGGQECIHAFGRKAFSAPPRVDSTELQQLASARCAAAEDELWLLQTDAAYAELRVKQLRELKFSKAWSKAMPDAWRVIAVQLTEPALTRAQVWRWICQELSHVSKLEKEYASKSIGDGAVPDEYAMAHGSLQTLVTNCFSQVQGMLLRFLQTLPGFQRYFKWHKHTVGGQTGVLSVFQGDAKCSTLFEQDPLFWAMLQLFSGDSQGRVEANLSFYFAFIEDHLNHAAPEEKARVDQMLADTIADLAAMLTILSTLEYHRPVIPAVDVEKSVLVHGDRDGPMSTWRNCTKEPIAGLNKSEMTAIGRALEDFAREGWPKGVKDQAWLAKADRSRQALSRLWSAFETFLRTSLGTSGRSAEAIEYDAQLLRFHLRPEHVAGLQAERDAILSVSAPKAQRQEHSIVPIWDTESGEPSNAASSIRKAGENIAKKKKRRDQLALPATSREAEDMKVPTQRPASTTLDHVAQLAKPQEPLTVSAATLRFFKSMFGPDTTTSFKWVQLVAAMVDAGCVATHNGGSAVTFKHATGSIAFHRPHPDPTVDPVMLHAMGKRLGRRFGWRLEVFQEREKGAA
ncbi:hypothetical protein LTR85_003348 [Meristemomyces frigidus]|nr:hypothetical protein LTR85_003348 [Meristemomyces frigidus]